MHAPATPPPRLLSTHTTPPLIVALLKFGTREKEMSIAVTVVLLAFLGASSALDKPCRTEKSK